MGTGSKINIVCATDDRYVPYCGIMLTSVFENNRDSQVDVYVLLDHPLKEENIDRFAKFAQRYGRSIRYCFVDKTFIERFPLKGDGLSHWSIVTYYRLYAADILPEEVDKALYLDCDIIVDGSLRALFDMDWGPFAIGAVPDMCTEWQEYYDRLGYDRAEGYFNAGVVLMNLDYWRRHNVGRQCLEYLEANYDRIFNNDQDVLNAVLRNQKKNLPVTYNYQIQLRMPYFYDTFCGDLQEDIQRTTSPCIIHYAAELKPWMVKYYSYPFNGLWHKYKRMSLWKNMPDALPDKRAFVAFVKRYVLWPLGIKLKKPAMI